jgi:four helix bundle protein
MTDFNKLKIWEKSHQLTLEIYKITYNFPKEELFGLTSQIRRSSFSIPANIAEGCGRSSDVDFSRFLYISMGSANETEYLIMLCTDLEYIELDKSQELLLKIQEIKKMLSSFINTLKTK